MTFDLQFSESNQTFDPQFSENNQTFDAQFGEVQLVHEGRNGSGYTTELIWTNPSPNSALDPIELTFDKDYQWYILEHDDLTSYVGYTTIRSDVGNTFVACRTLSMDQITGGISTTFVISYRLLENVTSRSMYIGPVHTYKFGYKPGYVYDDTEDKCIIRRIWGQY